MDNEILVHDESLLQYIAILGLTESVLKIKNYSIKNLLIHYCHPKRPKLIAPYKARCILAVNCKGKKHRVSGNQQN